jgi:hypothetical protein
MTKSKIALARERRMAHWQQRSRALMARRAAEQPEPRPPLADRLYQWTVLLDLARGQKFEGCGVDDLIADLHQAFLVVAASESHGERSRESGQAAKLPETPLVPVPDAAAFASPQSDDAVARPDGITTG